MMSNRLRIVVTFMSLTLLLAPALLWSNKNASRTTVTKSEVKLPPTSTTGREVQPYTLTRLEKDKLLRQVSVASPPRGTDGLPKLNAAPANAAYPGMTPAEIEKLTDWRMASKPIPFRASRGAPDVVSTVEAAPRAPGIEGLTPAERAKLESHIKRQQMNEK